MKKNEKNILTGVGIALAGFFAYRYYQKKKAAKQAEVVKEEAKKAETSPNKTTGYPGPYTGPSEYQKKVMELQSWLGVAVDGIPGPQTNGALSKKLSVTYSLVGPISPANVDQYLALKRGPANLWF